MKRLSLLAVLALLMGISSIPAGASSSPDPNNGVVAADQTASLATVGIQAAVPIDDELWRQFLFGGVGVPAVDCAGGCVPSSAGNSVDAGDPPWTFTAGSGGATLLVTDAFLSGDVFEVYDFGVSIGTTSASSTGESCGDDPEVCIINPAMSSGSFDLGPGEHSITITATASPSGGGAGYFRVVGPSLTVSGFFAPVDMGEVWNTVKAGSMVPLKFKVFDGDTEITDVAMIEGVTINSIECPDELVAADAIETLATSSAGGLRYSDDQFIQNWKTPKTKGCYEVTATTIDGTSITAKFILK